MGLKQWDLCSGRAMYKLLWQLRLGLGRAFLEVDQDVT